MKLKLGFPALIGAAALLGAAGGAGLKLGHVGRGAALEAESAHSATANGASSPATKADKIVDDKAGEKKKNDGKRGTADAAPSFFKFSRQFVAPVIRDSGPQALMILDVMIELSPEDDEGLYANEPKLRDAVLRALLAQSGKGELQAMLTDPALLESTRAAVLQNVREVIGDRAQAILLLDVAYQPF